MEWRNRFRKHIYRTRIYTRQAATSALVTFLICSQAFAGPSSTKNIPGDQIKRSGGAILSLPNVTDTLMGRLSTDTLTNKTLLDGSNSWANTADPTKKFQWSLSGITTGTTRTFTVPNATTTIVGTDVAQTLSNKSLSDALQFDQIATPSTPASGKQKLYPKSDGKFYTAKSDGTESALGSGSGGSAGFNMLVDSNPDLESGTGSLTSSGGSLTTASGASALFGLKSASWDASAAAQTLSTASITIPTGLQGANCLARLAYKGGDSNLTMEVYDGTNVVASQALATVSTATFISTSFICPSSGSLLLRLKASADAASVTIDQLHLGENFLLGAVAQATFYGSVKTPSTSGCFWNTPSVSNASPATPSATASCPTPTLSGNASAPATKIPAITFVSLQPGTYHFEAHGFFRQNGNNRCSYRFSDGTNSAPGVMIGMATGGAEDSIHPTIAGDLTYTTAQSNVTIAIQMSGASATASACQIDASSTEAGSVVGLEITAYRFPASSETAGRPDQTNWRVDANVGGANPAMSTASVATYTAISNSGLDIVTNAGSIPVQIPCDGTNPSTGSTCAAGNEEVGVVFNLPRAGAVEACAAFTYQRSQNTFTQLFTTFEIIETPNNSDTTLTQEGKSRTGSLMDTGGTANNNALPHTVCGTFEFTSAGQKTLRLMYEQENTAGTVASAILLADRNAATGQRDVHWTVRPINQSGPAPVFIGAVTNSSSGQSRVEAARSDGTTGTVYGTWATYSKTGTGTYVYTFSGGPFSSQPFCTASSAHGAGTSDSREVTILYSGTTSVTVKTISASAAGLVDMAHSLICIGPR
jgi:hypothetical protein